MKRIVRSWKLFAALALGMTLAATFFGGLNVAADTVGKQALDAQLTNTPVDVSLYSGQYGQGFANASTFQTLVNNVQTVSFVKSAESIGQATSFNGSLPQLWAIQATSALYQHITLVAGRMNLAANETIVNADASQTPTLAIGKTVRYTLASFYNGTRQFEYNATLRVVGQVSLDTVVQRTLGFGYYCGTPGFGGLIVCNPGLKAQSVMITSWEKTFAPALDWSYNKTRSGSSYSYALNARVNIYLDRNQLISPFDVEGSISQIRAIEARISSVAGQYNFQLQDNLLPELQGFSSEIFSLRIQYTVVSLPVFFLAWYVGRTVSQSSFNLRRKEIGLLMTRGFTRGQLFRQFLAEGIMVGVIAGSAGVVAAYLLNPVFIQVLGGGSTGPSFLSTDTITVTVLFALFLTFFSVFSPARQATSMDPAKALKEYVYLEETKPTRKRGAIIAFTLGLYQLILLVTGQNYMTFQRYFYGAPFFIAIILIIASVLSLGLTFIGPFLFLFGAASLSTGPAQRFHKIFASFSRRIIGDVAALASKSVFRNPRRVAALVFIVALIAGYSIWIIGDQASMSDYNYRQAQVENGSDIRISGLNTLRNATLVADQLRTGWSNVTGATVEADFTQNFYAGNLQVKAIDPLTWRQGAYYEQSWFSGDLDTTFSQMATNNFTLVLDHGVASYYSYFIGGGLNISKTRSLSIIGFFGPDYTRQNGGPFYYFSPEGWSYVPIKLLGENITQFSPSTTNIVLVKVASGFSITSVARSVQLAYPSLTVSAAEPSSQDTQGIINAGSQNVLRLGTAFAGLAAGIGVGTVAYTGYREREKEITMVAVRGLSYRQLAGLLVTEFLPVIIYALILATVVGLIVVWGDAQGQNSLNSGYLSLLEPRRVIFPLWASINIFAIVGLLLAGVFVPAAFAARKDLSKMSRTVRFA